MTPLSFSDKLDRAWKLNNSLLCVGIDPDQQRFAKGIFGMTRGILSYTKQIIQATAAHSCAYKFQIAHYAAAGAEAELVKTIAWVKKKYPEHLVILDAKRGDVGSTAEFYAKEAFERYRADAVTLNPYLGEDALEPFLKDPARGGILLCRTSNEGGGELQGHGESALFMKVAKMADKLWRKRANVGLVVGATQPEELRMVRAAAPDVPILAPGIGAQGGDLGAALRAGLNAVGTGILVAASRSIFYASESESASDDFAYAAGCEADRLCSQINDARTAY